MCRFSVHLLLTACLSAVAVPALGRGGTNALYLNPPDAISLHFGADSLEAFRREAEMKGVSYLIDDEGNKTGVILDLRRHRRIWEDIYDRLLIESRRHEPRVSLEQVRARMRRRKSKLHA